MINKGISWTAYLCLIVVESLEEVSYLVNRLRLLATEVLKQRFDLANNPRLLSQGGVRAERKEVI